MKIEYIETEDEKKFKKSNPKLYKYLISELFKPGYTFDETFLESCVGNEDPENDDDEDKDEEEDELILNVIFSHRNKKRDWIIFAIYEEDGDIKIEQTIEQTEEL